MQETIQSFIFDFKIHSNYATVKIAPDKKKHFFVAIPLGALLQFVSIYLFPVQPVLSSVLSFIALAAICYGFELFSLITGKGHYDNWDAIAGILGGILGIGLCWGLYTLL
ncbi:MAG: hypothetical protein ABIN67_03405 [Ferruginibacter sp.]